MGMMMGRPPLIVALTLGWRLGSSTASAASSPPNNKHQRHHPLLLETLPDTGEPWSSMENGFEFQPAAELSPLAEHHLRRLTWFNNKHGGDASAYQASTYFVDTRDTNYDEYAQAWRALGFYIDCDANQQQQDDGGGSSCQRYMLWAAYIDEGYSGHEVGEYMYYDRKSGQWSDYACYKAKNTERCVKMDCHLPTTHFKLIGYFKEPNYDEWMEQLFKHEGDCVWTDEEYQFMQGDRGSWPNACTATTDSQGNVIYYDLKPGPSGAYDIGLYQDAACIVEYEASSETRAAIIMMGDQQQQQQGQGENEENMSLDEILLTWNNAFDVFKQCQPCKTYKLTNVVAGMGYEANLNGDRYAGNGDDDGNGGGGRDRKLEDGEDGDEEEFQCDDAAGYNDVNQCMKFKTKTKMLTASWGDVIMAGNQGTIATYVFPNGETSVSSSNTLAKMKQRGKNSVRDNPTPVWVFLFLFFSVLVFSMNFLRFMNVYSKSDGEYRRGKGFGWRRGKQVGVSKDRLLDVDDDDDDEDDEEYEEQVAREEKRKPFSRRPWTEHAQQLTDRPRKTHVQQQQQQQQRKRRSASPTKRGPKRGEVVRGAAVATRTSSRSRSESSPDRSARSMRSQHKRDFLTQQKLQWSQRKNGSSSPERATRRSSSSNIHAIGLSSSSLERRGSLKGVSFEEDKQEKGGLIKAPSRSYEEQKSRETASRLVSRSPKPVYTRTNSPPAAREQQERRRLSPQRLAMAQAHQQDESSSMMSRERLADMAHIHREQRRRESLSPDRLPSRGHPARDAEAAVVRRTMSSSPERRVRVKQHPREMNNDIWLQKHQLHQSEGHTRMLIKTINDLTAREQELTRSPEQRQQRTSMATTSSSRGSLGERGGRGRRERQQSHAVQLQWGD